MGSLEFSTVPDMKTPPEANGFWMACGNGVYAMSTRRASLISGIGFPSFVLVALVMGCSSSAMKTNPPISSGGSAGDTANSAGGTNSAGGAATAGTGGAAVTATGGSAVTTGGAPAGTGGSSTAATSGSTTVDCNPPVTTYCTGTAPPAALISDFSIAPGATAPVLFGTWGQSIFGGAYTYPGTVPACETGTVSAYPLTQTVTGGAWNIQGTVGDYSGMGLWWGCNTGTAAAPAYAATCAIDASAYTGISFTVSGSIGPAGNPKNCGTRTATTCGSSVAVPVTATATAVTLTWAQLGVTAPNAITGISFSFTDPFRLNDGYATSPFTATPYPVDVTIDDLQFAP